MYWLSTHWLPLLFIAGYLLLLAWHGWHGARKSKTLDHFLVGGRGLGGVVVALSYYATFVSSVTFVGHAGKSYTLGPSWWMVCVVVFTGMVLIAWFIVAPPFVEQSRRSGALTIPHFLGARYDSPALQRLAALVVVSASVVYMMAVYSGAALALGRLLDLPPWAIMSLIFLVVTAYTLIGGFHSVVATDAVQGLILFATALLLPAVMIIRQGGIGPILTKVHQAEPAALEWATGMPLLAMIGTALAVGFKIIVEPRQLSRFYGLSSHEQLRLGRLIAPLMLMLTYLCLLPVGILAHAYAPSADAFRNQAGKIQTDEVVPYLLGGDHNVLGSVLGAFCLTGLVAAAMSSLDSVLLVAASSADHDLFKRGRNAAAVMWYTRGWVVVLSAGAAVLAYLLPKRIVEVTAFSGSLYAACFLPTLVVGLYWQRATKAAALAALIVGFSATPLWFFARQMAGPNSAFAQVHEMFVGMPIAMVVFVVVSLLTPGGKTDSTDTGGS